MARVPGFCAAPRLAAPKFGAKARASDPIVRRRSFSETTGEVPGPRWPLVPLSQKKTGLLGKVSFLPEVEAGRIEWKARPQNAGRWQPHWHFAGAVKSIAAGRGGFVLASGMFRFEDELTRSPYEARPHAPAACGRSRGESNFRGNVHKL